VNTLPATAAPAPDSWPLQNPALYTLLWIVLLVGVFAPLSVQRYRRTTQH
jgi:hypothetical protein